MPGATRDVPRNGGRDTSGVPIKVKSGGEGGEGSKGRSGDVGDTLAGAAVMMAGWALARSLFPHLGRKGMKKAAMGGLGAVAATMLGQALKSKGSTKVDGMNTAEWTKMMEEVRKSSGWGVDKYGDGGRGR